ncbi:MAG: hypothetical protein Kow0092_16140 [Deferrisomatales bacterium]
MARPAGVQIRRWFTVLVVLLILVDLAALAGGVAISRSVRVVVDRAVPLAAATAATRHEILAAQRELFRYLSEFTDDTSSALGHLDRLEEQVAAARAASSDPAVVAELDAIETSARRYRKVIELMPGTVAGSRDWSRLQEYSATAVELGFAVEHRASRLAEAAQEEIRTRSVGSARVASVFLGASVAVLFLSLLLVLRLRHWWRQFQDLILGF